MSKKKRKYEDEEELINDEINEVYDDESEETEEIDLNIEIDEENYEDDEDEYEDEEDIKCLDEYHDFDTMFKGTVNKHKLEGTHTLKRDTIFLGKEEKIEDEMDLMSAYMDIQNESYEIEKGTNYEYESRNFEEYYYGKQLVDDIYNILKENTNIDFLTNRRKPNKQTFNEYYSLCVSKLNTKYSKSEIFVELSYYFTDNIFNMFKLLNKKNATGIILELKEKGYLTDIGNINFI